MTISQAVIKIVIGTKGNNHYKWWRLSRTKLDTVANRVSSIPSFYYAKIYHYDRLGKRKGNVGQQIAYIYWKDGVLTTVLT